MSVSGPISINVLSCQFKRLSDRLISSRVCESEKHVCSTDSHCCCSAIHSVLFLIEFPCQTRVWCCSMSVKFNFHLSRAPMSFNLCLYYGLTIKFSLIHVSRHSTFYAKHTINDSVMKSLNDTSPPMNGSFSWQWKPSQQFLSIISPPSLHNSHVWRQPRLFFCYRKPNQLSTCNFAWRRKRKNHYNLLPQPLFFVALSCAEMRHKKKANKEVKSKKFPSPLRGIEHM